MSNKHRNPTHAERDERVVLPLDPETALRNLLAVDPDDEIAKAADGAPSRAE